MTRAELRTLVYDLTGRPTTYSRLTTTQIDEYLNEAAMRFAQETLPPSLLDTVSFNTVNGTHTYEVTGIPLRVVSVALAAAPLTQTTLQRLAVSYPAWSSAASGTPTHWFPIGRDGTTGSTKVRLWPTPGSTLAATATVLKKPAALPSSGEILEWDELECYGFAYFAAWRHLSCKTEVDEDGAKDTFRQNFDAMLEQYRRINGVESYQSQEAGVQSGWRAQG